MNKSNQRITFKGEPAKVTGKEVHEGESAPDFRLTGSDMRDLKKSDFAGKIIILSVVPSVDTPVCAAQMKRFNSEASNLSQDVQVLTVSMDLPFALKRFCAAEGIERVQAASDYKYRNFGEAYGVQLADLGLLARAVFVIDRSGAVKHVEYVAEVASEPDYGAAIESARQLL